MVTTLFHRVFGGKMGGFFARIIGYLLAFIYKLVGNYGISIIILTFIVRLLLLPLYNRQNKYSAVMNELQPKVKEIQTRYAADRNTMNEKINELYQQAEVSPLSGCLPLIIQLPIIMGLFTLLRNPAVFMSAPSMVTAAHESFLWIGDLSQPDNWILPILAGITTYLTSASVPDSSGSSTMVMKYFFPIMIFLFGKSYPAGTALYWAIGNLFTYGQTLYFNKKRKKQKREKAIEEEAQKRAKKMK